MDRGIFLLAKFLACGGHDFGMVETCVGPDRAPIVAREGKFSNDGRNVKINGTVFREVKNSPPFPSFKIYKVRLKNGPMDGHEALAGNTTVVFLCGHRYELNAEGDFVYAPKGLN